MTGRYPKYPAQVNPRAAAAVVRSLMEKLYIELDMRDVTAFLEVMAKAVDGWSEDRKTALARDMKPLFDDGSAIVMDTSGSGDGSCAAIVSPAMHDVLRRHGAVC